ncbi:MAG: YfhO family protein [Spirosomataceae bacterium]
MTLLIPNFSGGSSGGELNEKSEVYKTLGRYNIPPETAIQFARSLPTYWGDQTFVGGGVYAGAIICFLFILGLFIADKRYRWPFGVGAVFFLMIAWGKNLSIINYTLFDYFPMFNKFRAVSMALSLTQLCMVVVAALAVKKLVEDKSDWKTLQRPFFISLGLTGGLALLFTLIPGVFDFRAPGDTDLVNNLTQQFGNNRVAANELYSALLSDRSAMLRSDAFRSLLFILLAAGIMWAYIAQKLKNPTMMIASLVVLTLIDMWTIDKRYLNEDSFQPKYRSYEEVFQPTAANQQIMQDTDPNYRVIDVTTSPFQDAKASYFHKSLGGYHGASLKRYREVVDAHISKNNMAVFNMLNTKYFIVPGQDGQPTAQRNPDALGNAWFVKEVKIVNNADEELKALEKFDPRQTAFVDKRFADQLQNIKPQADTTAQIRLTAYKPHQLTYESDAKSPEVAIFSEIYYRGGIDWKAFVDGQETPHFRANYILRGMVVPAGKHKIEFKFDPPAVKTGQNIDRIAAIAWLLLVAGAVFIEYRQKSKNSLKKEA